MMHDPTKLRQIREEGHEKREPDEVQQMIARIEAYVKRQDEAEELITLRWLRKGVVGAIAGGHIRCDCPKGQNGAQVHDVVCIVGKYEPQCLAMRKRWECGKD